MPIEIRELTIKARVESSDSRTSDAETVTDGRMKDAQINMIVDKILRILKERTER